MIGQTISHYRVLGQVGEGGMGVVYVAEDTRLGRRVALKIPHAGRDERQYRARFLREARAVSVLTHKNIAAVYDYGEDESGQPYIVMELVTGQTLGEILTGAGLSLRRAVEVICDVAEALAEAHRRGIVHRDIKPSNVIVNDRGEVKVLDFGLAKQFDDAAASAGLSGSEAQTLLSAHTRSDVVIGTPLYLSPEQARGGRVDGRSDLFALGALLYECVAGRPAFSGSNVIEIGAQVLHVDPPPPSRFNPRVPAELDRVALKALAKKPEDRYQTADELAADLARAGARLAGSDTARTRRLETAAYAARTSALNTLTQSLSRPRFSPLALLAVLAAALLSVWAFLYWSRPTLHRPGPGPLASYERGVAAMRDGAFHRASLLFKEAVEGDGRFALAYARLAEARSEMDFLDAAKDDLLVIQQLVPERSALPERDRLYLEGVTATVRRDYPAAVAAYERLARLDPGSPPARVDLGRAREKNNELDRAVADYTEATTRDPSYATAFLRLGVLHARRKELAAASSNFDRAARLYAAAGDAEGEGEVAYQRGRLLVELRRRAEARPEIERALELARATGSLYQQVRAAILRAYVEDDLTAAQARTLAAAESARANAMHDLTALGLVTTGNVAMMRRDHAEAEKFYRQALDAARAHKVRRYEALALLQMGGLRNMQGRQDEAQPLLEQARAFFLQGGYRKEAEQALTLLGRVMRRRGDYEGALRTNGELISAAEAVGDTEQLGFLRRDRGSILHAQERLPQALAAYEESLSIYKRLGDQTHLTYVHLNRADALWRLGLYDEAAAALAAASELLAGAKAANKSLLGDVALIEAHMALSRLRFAEAAAGVRRALALFGASAGDVAVEAKTVQCLAESNAGGASRGLPLCVEALREAEAAGDPALVSSARLALARARLAAGDARAALEEALGAHEAAARVGRIESEWRSLALAAESARRAGDDGSARAHAARAAAALSRLEQEWGAEAAAKFYERPDVRALREAAEASRPGGTL
jgi:serine/threonine protein kinase